MAELEFLLLFDQLLFFDLDLVVLVPQFLHDELFAQVVVLSPEFGAFELEGVDLADVVSLLLWGDHHGPFEADHLVLPEFFFVHVLLVCELFDHSA